MQEIFETISDEVRKTAEEIWNLTVVKTNPVEAATFLDNTVNYYKKIYTEEEIEFLQFYLNMRMEMMKE